MTKLTRRTLGLTAAAAVLAPAFRAMAQTNDLKTAARDMWLFSLPLIEMARTRLPAGGPPNRLNHTRVLAGPSNTGVTTPNNDTLYSTAWLDLRGGPVQLVLPATGTRYISVALMDMYTNNFAVPGTRTNGGGGGTFTIVGPNDPSPDGPRVLRSPTGWVWMLVRTLVASEVDLDAAHAVQDGVVISGGVAGAAPVKSVPRTAPWQDYFTSAQALITESPPPPAEFDVFSRNAALGIKPGERFDPARFTPEQGALIAGGIAEARALLAQPVGAAAVVGQFGRDYTTRARIALTGLAALPREEAIYTRIAPPAGQTALDGAKAYRLTFSKAQLPPVAAFWSLSMYRVTPEGQMYFAENAIHRYAIGDRTPGLIYNADGSLDIWISSADPGPERRSNWLPAPPTGPISLNLRGYLPKKVWLDGQYQPPALAAL